MIGPSFEDPRDKTCNHGEEDAEHNHRVTAEKGFQKVLVCLRDVYDAKLKIDKKIN